MIRPTPPKFRVGAPKIRGVGALRAPDPEPPTVDEVLDEIKHEMLSEGQELFKRQRLAERARFKLNTETEYWCCLVFETREQKEAFCRHFNAVKVAGGDKYLNGVKMAAAMGVDIGPPVEWPGQKGPDPRYSRFVKRRGTD